MQKIFAVSTHTSDSSPIWLVRGTDPRELAVLAVLTEFGGVDAMEAVGAHCLIIEEPRGLRVVVGYQRGVGAVRYGTGDAEHNVYVTETDEDHARMWTGPSFHGTMYDSIDEIEYGRTYREIARLAVHDQHVLRQRVAGRHAIAALTGEDGIDQPAVSRVGWLKSLLDEIDASPEVLKLLERDDADGLQEMLRECRALATYGMQVVRGRHEATNRSQRATPTNCPSTAATRARPRRRRSPG